MSVDIDRLREWIGRSETRSDIDYRAPRLGYFATLGGDGELPAHGRAVPAGLHWCLAPTIVPLAEIGPDGHPERGGSPSARAAPPSHVGGQPGKLRRAAAGRRHDRADLHDH